jgi:copper chaperone CopZ
VIKLFGKKGKGKEIALVVRGMSCGHCEMRVKKALSGVPGVLEASASHEKEQAVVVVGPGQTVAVETLIAAVQAAGYEAESG